MSSPHLTPEKLLGSDILPANWQAASTAIMCFTPFPNGLKKYVQETAPARYFLHSPNSEVRLCRFEDIAFIVVSEVYGFAVGATTVEELVHHGIRDIIGMGYVGAFNAAPVGQHFIARDTLSDLPLAEHYGVPAYVRCGPSPELFALVNECVEAETAAWGRFTVWNGNSLYRESPQVVQRMKAHGCDVVNMDTLSIYAVTPVCARDAGRRVDCVYVGTVTDSTDSTDSMEGQGGDWDSDLIEAVRREQAHPHDNLARFVVETILPRLERQPLQ